MAQQDWPHKAVHETNNSYRVRQRFQFHVRQHARLCMLPKPCGDGFGPLGGTNSADDLPQRWIHDGPRDDYSEKLAIVPHVFHFEIDQLQDLVLYIRRQRQFSAKINFQPASAAVPSGYLADTGLVYGDRGNGYTYGWNTETSQTRDRNSANSPDQRYDTLNSWYNGANDAANGIWEIAVPNGTYSVHVVAGDADYYDSVFKINVEGVLTVNGTPTSTTRWIEGTQTVTVNDGKLTVSRATGSYNNNICFIDIY